MHPRDLTLGPDIASCAKLGVVCASSESYNDLIVLGNDHGRSADEFIEDGSAFCCLIAGSQVLRQGLVEHTGDEDQL